MQEPNYYGQHILIFIYRVVDKGWFCQMAFYQCYSASYEIFNTFLLPGRQLSGSENLHFLSVNERKMTILESEYFGLSIQELLLSGYARRKEFLMERIRKPLCSDCHVC